MRRAGVTLFNYGLTDLLMTSLESTLALKLHSDFKLETPAISLFFIILLVGYAIFCLGASCLPKSWDRRTIIIAGNVLISLAPFVIGPSKLLHLPNTLVLIGIGLFVGGGG